MEAALHHLLLFSLFLQITCLIAQRPSLPNAFLFPVTKDVSTLQYTTKISMGTDPHLPTKLVLDLGGSYIWADCASRSVSSPSQSYIQSGTLPCSMAKAGYSSPTCVITHKGICEIHPQNTITGMTTAGLLTEDILTVNCQDRTDHFLFSCTSSLLLKGLAGGAKGMLGLGRSKLSLPSQLSNVFGFHRKFALCLSSSDGVIFAGGSPRDISRALVYTPLISPRDGAKEEYYINVKSIKVDGKRLSLGKTPIGEAKLSTIVPYTTLERKIYETLTKAYIQAATSLNMSRAANSVAPFGVCFSSKGVEKASMGPAVPNIDLVLQSEMVKWRIHGRNSMVQVSDEVMCLGLLDGGLNPKNSIVIGGYQLEDNLLEFNLGTSVLGFSSSILMEHAAGCSSFRSVSELRGTL